MRRRGGVIAAGALLAALVAAPAPATAGPSCDDRSWRAGVTEWCGGALVHRDHVYDDYGADNEPGSPHGTSLNRPAGDVDHREHDQSLNSADLLVLRVRLEGRRLHARFQLNTLFPSDRTIAAIAVDTDGKASTGGGDWGRVAVSSRGWDEVFAFDRRDPGANVIAGSARLRTRLAPRIRIQAVVALGDGTPMNVAFRGAESGSWWEVNQAAALAEGDVSGFGVWAATRDFGRSLTRPAPQRATGFHDRVYRSRYPMGEGVSAEGEANETSALFHYLGRHQPYALYVPARRAPHGAQLVLHGASAAHASVVGQDGMQARFGDDLNRILVSPLGRGPNNSYVDWGARDALDALADVERHYPVDREAEFVSGYSMGGGGTLFLSTLFPDRWAGAVDWVGFSGDCLNGTPFAQGRQREAFGGVQDADTSGVTTNDAEERGGCPLGTRSNFIDYLDNLRHVPIAHLFAAADELVWVNHDVGVRRVSAELGYEHVVWTHAAEHLTFAVLDDWAKEAVWTKGRRRTQRPARVTYRTNAFRFMPEVDLIPDGAYWVDGMRPRNDDATPQGDMLADLVSHACRSTERSTALEYGAGVDPVPWVSQESVPTGVVEVERGRRISGRLVNLSEVTIDVRRACLAPGDAVELDVEVDGPTTVRFSDGRPDIVLKPD